MSRNIRWLLLGAIACGGSAPGSHDSADAAAEEPPVALNAEPTVQYPPTMYDQGIQGDVELRLFVDSTGRLSPESTKVSESSGYAALDTAAVRGMTRLRYAPARRHGVPVATSFLQTVEFRRPGAAAPARPVTRRDSTPVVPRVRADSPRVRSDTARPPASQPTPPTAPDTTKSKPDTSGAAS